MALTDAEIVSARRHLGVNAALEALYPFVETFFSVKRILTTLPAATEDEVRAILACLDAREASIDRAHGDQALAVGSITLNPRDRDILWTEIRRWRRELSTLVGIPLRSEVGSMLVV